MWLLDPFNHISLSLDVYITCPLVVSATKEAKLENIFKMLSVDWFGGPDDKYISRKAHNTNLHKYKGSLDPFAKII